MGEGAAPRLLHVLRFHPNACLDFVNSLSSVGTAFQIEHVAIFYILSPIGTSYRHKINPSLSLCYQYTVPMGLAMLSFSSFYLNYRPDGTRYYLTLFLLPKLASRWDSGCTPGANLGEVILL